MNNGLGYIRLWRKLLLSVVFVNEGLLKVFIWCLLRANHKETFVQTKTGRGISEVKLMPGTFIFGRESAAKELHMSPSTVWKRILKLKKLEILNIESNSHFSIIYIINWASYQVTEKNSNSDSDRQGTGKEHRQECKECLNNNINQNSEEILSYLNKKTGKKYRNKKHIEARLNNGATAEDCKRVIDAKIADPYFVANPKYLNPETLFRPSNFDRYSNETEPIQTEPSRRVVELMCKSCGRRIYVEGDLTEAGCIYCEMRMEAQP